MTLVNGGAESVRANFFDASALVKLYVEEAGSKELREYWAQESTKYTTHFCFYEALNALKVKWLYRKEINFNQYDSAASQLIVWFGATMRQIDDLDFISPSVLTSVGGLVTKYSIYFSDAFQILSVKEGFFSPLCGGSQTVLVTADKKLAKVARLEGLRVWNLMKEPPP